MTAQLSALDRVCAAIAALNEEGGSHLASIVKWLEGNGHPASGVRRTLQRGLARSALKRHEGEKYSLVKKAPKVKGQKKQCPGVHELEGEGQSASINGVTLTLIGKAPQTGLYAESGDLVTMQYKGMLKEDMKAFDQGNMDFRLGQGDVITGLDRGIPGMREGEKRRFDIPWHLAYGQKGYKKTIPPKADLVFIVQLIKVRKSYESFTKGSKKRKR
eukprot:GGOE01040515.1.p1 GENE.GGOE01040515.1~~GGOE01040515.1.p1  ORF type:complete len:216 (-),score=50.25 GGOE01040515.1:243-890(-)